MKRFLILIFILIGFLFFNSKPDSIKEIEATTAQCAYDSINVNNLYCD